MSAYNPPLFNNSVIQFNPTIYETGTTSTASQSLTLLKTDNIQCLLPNDLVSLYTVGSGQVTIGTGGQGVKVVGLLSTSLADITGITTNDIGVQTGQNSISIGTSAATVLIRPTTTQISGNLQANNIDKYTSGAISLYQTAVGAITLGNNATNVDIQAIRISAGSIYPSSSQTLYLGNANCPTIAIGSGAGVTSTVNIGAGTTTTNTMGTTTNLSVNGNYYHEMVAGGNNCYHDFHSCDTGINDHDGRIICTGGTSGSNDTATMTISSGIISIAPVGNLTLGSGTTVNTYVKSSSSVIGTNPTSYSSGGGTTIGKNVGTIISASTETDILFWSADVGVAAQPSASISVNGGTSSVNSGALTINAKNISLHAIDTASILSCDATTINVGTSNTTTVNMNAPTLQIGQGNTTNINIGTNTATTNLNIGNSTINPVKIQTSDRVVMGNSPSTYVASGVNAGRMTSPAVVVGTNGTTSAFNAFVDFYTFDGTLQSNSARIIAGSGGLLIANNIPSQPLLITSTQNINLNPAVGNGVNVNNAGLYLYGGLAYGKGNLTSPSFTQTGGFGNGATTVAANSVVNYSATWAAMGLANFGTAPTVICCNGCSSGLGQKLVMSCYGATTTQVSFSLYNPSSTTTGSVTISITFIATGGY